MAAMKKKPMTGVDKVIKNLNDAVTKIVGDTGKGIVKVALLVLRDSKKLTPIRLGNLRGSGYVVVSGRPNPSGAGGGDFKGDDAAEMATQHATEKLQSESEAKQMTKSSLDATAAIGYSAVYALSVHENPNAGSSGNTGEADKKRKSKKVPLSTVHSKRGQWKFLEEPLKTNSARALEIIRKEAAI